MNIAELFVIFSVCLLAVGLMVFAILRLAYDEDTKVIGYGKYKLRRVSEKIKDILAQLDNDLILPLALSLDNIKNKLYHYNRKYTLLLSAYSKYKVVGYKENKIYLRNAIRRLELELDSFEMFDTWEYKKYRYDDEKCTEQRLALYQAVENNIIEVEKEFDEVLLQIDKWLLEAGFGVVLTEEKSKDKPARAN